MRAATKSKRRPARGGARGSVRSAKPRQDHIIVPIDDANVKMLTVAWLKHDDNPPRELLLEIASRFDIQLAAKCIDEVGAVGRLKAYAPHFSRFVALREQSARLLSERTGEVTA
jgi:hypothetical protein